MNNIPNIPYVFDTSAIIALIKKEPGAEIVAKHLNNFIISSVNYSEVASILIKKLPPNQVVSLLNKFIPEIIPFTEEVAINAAILYPYTKEYGLSLGDKACIALAQAKNLPILTADKVWKTLEKELNIEVILIR